MSFLAANTQDGFGEHRDKKYPMCKMKYTAVFLMLWAYWHSMEAVAFFTPHPRPYFSCLFSCLVSSIERLSLHCSPNLKIMDLINWSLNAIDTIFSTLGFGGTWVPWRNVHSWLHDGRVGEVADRVSSGSFCGGHWRYLPIRNHDNRSSADWIRLCPGLSKNSENGNSCPKPHKAARHDLSSGKSGQHWDWDY